MAFSLCVLDSHKLQCMILMNNYETLGRQKADLKDLMVHKTTKGKKKKIIARHTFSSPFLLTKFK